MAEYYSLQELMRMIAKAVEAIADTVSDQEAREFVGEVLEGEPDVRIVLGDGTEETLAAEGYEHFR